MSQPAPLRAMSHALLISVRFLDGRYHGAGDWPPAPARLFQALVAAAALGESLSDRDRAALRWLEALPPPLIMAPAARAGQGLRSYVPNNDLDAVGGDIDRVNELRVSKTTKPMLFDAGRPFVYAWPFDGTEAALEQAAVAAGIAARLYQLGRSVDVAWATAEVVNGKAVEASLSGHGGSVHRPTHGTSNRTLLCPAPGSLRSLEERFRASRRRFGRIGKGRTAAMVFVQPPRPRFRTVSYDAPPDRLLFDIRGLGDMKAEPDFVPWPLAEASVLVTRVRDGVATRLATAFRDKAAIVERLVIGRDASEADKGRRVRIVPLPSIGHAHVDRAIRRVLLEVPADCPLAPADVAWAASGLELAVDGDTGEVTRPECVLTTAQDRRLLRRYGIDRPARLWRSATPLALPQAAARRRIEPARQHERGEWKGADERLREERNAVAGVVRALRHAGVDVAADSIRVQREPFARKGARAEAFAGGTRFAKERLWHVEIGFAAAVDGPLLLGDGRYLGLGLMEPVAEAPRDLAAFSVPAGVGAEDRGDFLRAVRRALMVLSRDGSGNVPTLFSGHEADGGPAAAGHHRHVFLACIGGIESDSIDQLIVAAPWACDRSLQRTVAEAALFERVVSRLGALRAGRLGVLDLLPCAADPRLVGHSRVWESETDYRPTRQAGRGKDPEPALLRDLLLECRRRGLPEPKAEVTGIRIGPRAAASATLRLRFSVAVSGPLLLGRDSHKGGGVFRTSGELGAAGPANSA